MFSRDSSFYVPRLTPKQILRHEEIPKGVVASETPGILRVAQREVPPRSNEKKNPGVSDVCRCGMNVGK